MNLGQSIAAKDSSDVSSRKMEKQAAFVGSIRTGFAQRSDVNAFQMHTPNDAAPEL